MDTALLDVVPAADIRDVHIGVRPTVRPRSPHRAGLLKRSRMLRARLLKDAIVRERRRGDRSGSPFTVLLVERHDRPGEPRRWAPILRALDAVKRDTDIVGWLQKKRVVGVVLPDTPGKAALKIMRHLRREIDKRLGAVPPAAVSITAYGYGQQDGSDGPAFAPVDQLIDAFVEPRAHPARDGAKRSLDILGSLALLLLFAPLLLAIFGVVKMTSPGPVLFRQVRVGRKGQLFTMLKFRTMYADAGHGVHQDYVTWFIKSSSQQPRTGNEVYKLTNDPRITPAGHFLRKTSLDELPQFWNVLRGDMSLVGPRPPLPFEVEQYKAWHRRRVLDAKPGVTGPWQVYGRSRTTFDEMVRLDLDYSRTHTLWTDIKILAATPRAMVSGKGAA